MNIYRIITFICIIVCFCVQGAFPSVHAEEGQTAFELDTGIEEKELDEYIEVFIDKDRAYTIEDIVHGSFDGTFERFNGKGRPSYGYSSAYYWARVEIENPTGQDDWLLEIDAPKTNYVTVYIFDEKDKELETIYTGNYHPFDERKVEHRNFVIPLKLDKGESNHLYIRYVTGSSVQFPLKVWDYHAFQNKSQNEYALLGAIIGLSVVMAMYNLFLFFSVRDRSYIYYVLFVLLNTLLFIVDTGLSYQYIWPHLAAYETITVTELMFLSNIAALLFIRAFLTLHERSPLLNTVFKLLIVFNVIAFIIRQFTFTGALYLALGLVLMSIISIMYAATQSLLNGFRPARYILIAWGLFLLGVFISLMVDVGVIPLTFFTKYAWQMTTSLEVILLSFALGDKYKMFREEKEGAVREANETQRKALENLRRTDELKDEFLTITSHELQTPLNGIIGIAETMRAGAVGPLHQEMDAHLSMIVTSGKRLSHLVDDILVYSNLKKGTLRMSFGPVRMHELVNLVLTICQPLVGDKRIELVNELHGDEEVQVYVDEDRVQQILYNLIGNAIKYTDEGKVVVSSSFAEEFLTIHVTDTGKGIPYEAQEQIFEQFYQVEDGDTREASGTGIGLNITKQLVERHGGSIHLESVLGKGTIVSFTLPLYTGEQTVAKRERSMTPIAPVHAKPTIMLQRINKADRQATVLIADDDPVNLQVLMNRLHLNHYEVITASNGKEVLELVEKETIDLLILDIMMPRMSGFEVCRTLRKEYSLLDLPILMLTAKTQVKDKVVAFEVGANDYLEKPCNEQELLTRVQTLIQLRNLNKELKKMNNHLEEKVKQRTKELHVANEHLQQLAASRTMLLGNIAHDLGTPVTVIYNYMQALDHGLIKDSEKAGYVQLVYNKIHVLNRLISDLFDLSKLEADQLTFDFRSHVVKEWMEDVQKRMRLEMAQTKRKFSFHVKNMDDNAIFHIDTERIDQVFSNLLRNAVNHTKEEEGEVAFSIQIREACADVLFAISDNGVGMGKEELPHIFERYYKTTKKTTEYDGAGIGLTIVKELVHAHGGEIWVESELDVGTTFYLTLPLDTNLEKNGSLKDAF